MGVLCLVFLICALRTNIVFVVIFLTLVIAFILLTIAYWAMAADITANAALSSRCLVVRIRLIPRTTIICLIIQ
jgi:uncharacterized protein